MCVPYMSRTNANATKQIQQNKAGPVDIKVLQIKKKKIVPELLSVPQDTRGRAVFFNFVLPQAVVFEWQGVLQPYE